MKKAGNVPINWTDFPRRAIHLDFHTMPGIYDVGRDFDADEFAETLARAEVDYITVFARCNLGFAYYPTKIGTIHPGLKQKDLLGPMVSACHKRGISVAAYFNAGLDHEHALRHREWVKVTKEGKVYDYQQMGHWFRNMCLNTGYRDHLKTMIREILGKYPVDGLFLDCFSLTPCYGTECLEGMQKRGMNVMEDGAVTEFCRIITIEFMDEVKALCKQMRKNIYICFNGMPYSLQPKHIELEILPTGGWGYDYLPFCIRYARTLGKPFFTMTGRFFKSWGDFGGLRSKHSLLFDCYNSLANGGTCSIGDHMHPRGRLEQTVYATVGETYREVKQFDQWTEGVETLADMAVVYPPIRDFPQPHPLSGYVGSTIQGAARMLMELKYQFDIIDKITDSNLSRYRVLILPDNVAVDSGLAVSLRKFLANNGIIISSASSGLNPEKTRFALPEYGLDYAGPSPNNIEFFRAGKEVAADLPDMPISVYSPGIVMHAGKRSKVLARVIQPYFNLRSWDRFHENLYVPPEKDAGRPALTQCGRVLHFSFPIFSGYFEHAVTAYKNLLRNSLARVFSDPMVKVEGLPSFGQVTVTAQGQRRMVHLLTYLPELRGRTMQVIEEPISVRNVSLALRTDGRRIRTVYLAPSRANLDFIEKDGYIKVTVPEVKGYQLVVFEYDERGNQKGKKKNRPAW